MRNGEALICNLIAELQTKADALHEAQRRCTLGPRTVRARLRWLREDYDKLANVARRWGFKIPA